jgi:hypothetical protein
MPNFGFLFVNPAQNKNTWDVVIVLLEAAAPEKYLQVAVVMGHAEQETVVSLMFLTG